MNTKLTILTLLLTFICYSQEKTATLTKEGKLIVNDGKTYIWKSKNKNFSYSFEVKNDTVFYSADVPKFKARKVNYSVLKEELEKLTNKKFSDSSFFLINYNYYNDYGGRATYHVNTIDQYYINHITKFNSTKIKKAKRKNKNLVYIILYEKGIVIENFKKRKDIYFIDINDFFRKNLFTTPVHCGSISLTKPNGETLIRNGEVDVYQIIELLDQDNWNTFFEKKENN